VASTDRLIIFITERGFLMTPDALPSKSRGKAAMDPAEPSYVVSVIRGAGSRGTTSAGHVVTLMAAAMELPSSAVVITTSTVDGGR
jgi:hypothetical protein